MIYSLYMHIAIFSHLGTTNCVVNVVYPCNFPPCFWCVFILYNIHGYFIISFHKISVLHSLFQEPLLHNIVYCSLFVQCFDLVYKEPSCVQKLTMSLSLISNLHAYRHIEVISRGNWTKESQIFWTFYEKKKPKAIPTWQLIHKCKVQMQSTDQRV